ncbi:MAG: Lrp/AsnC family transcriptional regulator [Candidatus Parvarchaeota archaeon]|jgi:Lrp/AsnC family leucine-responsive transcriptional regulator|nr:Lrp/AsnC family transcriptional regulator [Candidatus Parvarchaeota archaeon]
MKIKEKDTRILDALRKGESVNSLAQRFKLPKSTIYYHLTKLKKIGFIKGIRVSMDYEQMPEHRAALVLVSLNKTNLKDVNTFEEELQRNSIVSDIYGVTGDWDFLLVIHGTKQEITKFIMESIQSMPNVKRTHSLFIMKHIEL